MRKGILKVIWDETFSNWYGAMLLVSVRTFQFEPHQTLKFFPQNTFHQNDAEIRLNKQNKFEEFSDPLEDAGVYVMLFFA